VKVALPDVANLLNAGGQTASGQWPVISGRRSSRMTHHSSLHPKPYAQPPGAWRRIASDVNGEWGFYLILDQFLKSSVESRRAAAGWAGDRFAVYEKHKRRSALHLALNLDTEADAREFFDAYVKRTGLRYPDAASIQSTTNAQPLTVSKSFRTSEAR